MIASHICCIFVSCICCESLILPHPKGALQDLVTREPTEVLIIIIIIVRETTVFTAFFLKTMIHDNEKHDNEKHENYLKKHFIFRMQERLFLHLTT